MADHAAGDDIFVYTGGIAPQHVVNAIIDESVDEIEDEAFRNNRNLKSLVCHEGVLRVGKRAFYSCRSLQRVKMPGVKIIEKGAFYDCKSLVDVELDKLETVGDSAFTGCKSLKRIEMPKVKIVGRCAFSNSGVEDTEFSEELETIGSGAFRGSKLRHIAIPLKDGMFQLSPYHGSYTQFHNCNYLTTVDLVGGIHKTVASLHLESWTDEIVEEIQRISQILPPVIDEYRKTDVVRQWMQSVNIKFDHYKAEHRALVKEATTLLELALWKAKVADFTADDDKKCSGEKKTTKKTKIDVEEARKEARITSGADIIIKNVLPYLETE